MIRARSARDASTVTMKLCSASAPSGSAARTVTSDSPTASAATVKVPPVTSARTERGAAETAE